VFQTHDDDLANEANDILFAARLSLASFLHVSTLSWHGPWGPLLMERARARRSRLHWSRSGKRGIGASPHRAVTNRKSARDGRSFDVSDSKSN